MPSEWLRDALAEDEEERPPRPAWLRDEEEEETPKTKNLFGGLSLGETAEAIARGHLDAKAQAQRAFDRGMYQVGTGLAGTAEALSDPETIGALAPSMPGLTGPMMAALSQYPEMLAEVRQGAHRTARHWQEQREALTLPQDRMPPTSSWNRFATALIENVPTLLATMGTTAATGNPLAGMSFVGSQEMGQHYLTLKEQQPDIPEDQARASAAGVGIANALLEYIPLGRLSRLFRGQLKPDTVKDTFKVALSQAGREGGTEALQEATGWFSELLNSGKTVEEFQEENPLLPRMREAGAVGGALGLFTGGGAVLPQAQIAPEPDQPLYEMNRPELEEQVQLARLPVDKSLEETLEAAHEQIRGAFQGFTTEMKDIPHGPEHVRFRESMRMIRDATDSAVDQVAQEMGTVMQSMNAAEQDLFVKKRLIDDLRAVRQEYPEGTQLPFKVTDKDLETDGSGVDEAVAQTPAVSRAIAADQQMWSRARRDLGAGLEALGMNTDWLHRRGDAYMHHKVIEYMAEEGGLGGTRKPKAPAGRGYQKQLKGSEKPISLRYAEAQGQVLAQMRHDAILAQELVKIRDDPDKGDIGGRNRSMLLNQLEKSQPQFGEVAEGYMVRAKDRDNIGTIRSISGNTASVFFFNRKTGAQATVNLSVSELEALPSAEHAFGMLIPEGYRGWQPADGRIFFTGMRLGDRIAQEIIDHGVAEVTEGELIPSKIMGPQKPVWVLPENIVNALEKQAEGVQRSRLAKIQGTWKRAMLFLPWKAPKYLTRNFVSDWSIALQGRPEVARNPAKIRAANRELADYIYRNVPPSPALEDFIMRGGLSSGLFHQEISASEKERLYKLTRSAQQQTAIQQLVTAPAEKIASLPTNYWRRIRRFTALMESTMRYAIFRDTLQELNENGGMPKRYMASLKGEIDALPDNETKAYWLTNELIGAYDMVSQHGQYLRSRLMPFWSFQELNIRAQSRLMRNALTDDRVAKAFTLKYLGKSALAKSPSMVLSAGRFLALAFGLEALLRGMNYAFFREEEEDLGEDVRRRVHAIFGRDHEGSVFYFDRLSRFREFMEWFGMGEFTYQDISDVLDGRRDPVDVASDMLTTIPDKVVNTIGPLPIKAPLEVAAGYTTFPSATRPRPLEDRTRQLFRMWGLEQWYDIALGRPTKAGGETLPEKVLAGLPDWFLYRQDPGQSNYYDSMALKRMFRREVLGREDAGHGVTDRSIALRRVKRALRYGQKETAEKYMRQYAGFLDTGKDTIQQSIRNMHPLRGIPEEHHEAYRNWLTPEEYLTVRQAIDWWEEFGEGVLGLAEEMAPELNEIQAKAQAERAQQIAGAS